MTIRCGASQRSAVLPGRWYQAVASLSDSQTTKGKAMLTRWRFGSEPGWTNLRCESGEIPQPQRGEVLVRLRAASLNYRDKLIATMPSLFQRGRVPLSDGAGEVVAVGAEVQRWRVGDRVAGCFFRDWLDGPFKMEYHQAALGGTVDGVLQTHAVFGQENLVAIPAGYSFEEAATLPCAGLTAWHALVERGQLQPGERVLTLGTGGVSIWALQIAKAIGAKVLITSSSHEKLERAIALGADQTISYVDYPDWDKRAFELTEKQGVEHVVEVGGAGTLARSLACLAAGGQIAMIGVLTGFEAPSLNVFPLVAKNATMHGIYVGHRRAFERFVAFLDNTQIRPVIDRVFEWDEAVSAYEYLHNAQHFGKIVIRIA